MLIRILFITVGTLSLMLGIIGVFVPGLPTTPFLLLTAGLYIRSSDRLYQMLIRNRFVGVYVTQWQKTKGLSLRSKIKAISFMSLMVTLSVIFMVDTLIARFVIIVLGLIGAVVMGVVVPTSRNSQ
jgi:uncharacterized membrane protein YbaN (DUF454 family)